MSLQPCYFVGRKELLAWINDFFQINYTKVEEVCSGALFCHMMDALHPGAVPLHKVNFLAKYDYEYIRNYKILQEVFTRVGVAKVIEVNKLIKGKYQDNLEFLQWMKGYFDENWQEGEYDAVARRKQCGIALQPQQDPLSGRNTGAVSRRPPTQPVTGTRPVNPTSRSSNARRISNTSSVVSSGTGNTAVLNQEVSKLRKHNAQLTITVDNLEKERDFYFCKLRDIEILCQDHPDISILREVEKILYATDEEENLEGVDTTLQTTTAAESHMEVGMEEE